MNMTPRDLGLSQWTNWKCHQLTQEMLHVMQAWEGPAWIFKVLSLGGGCWSSGDESRTKIRIWESLVQKWYFKVMNLDEMLKGMLVAED